MDTEKVLEVLRRVEWALLRDDEFCPYCYRLKRAGHDKDCKLAALLGEGKKEKADEGTGYPNILAELGAGALMSEGEKALRKFAEDFTGQMARAEDARLMGEQGKEEQYAKGNRSCHPLHTR